MAAVLAVAAVASAQPSSASLIRGAGLAALGLGLRGWAFAHLGGVGRTRDHRPPAQRVRSGPYRWVGHPVYLGNLILAGGALVAARPGAHLSAALGLGAVALWSGLARWEGARLVGAPTATARTRWRSVPRWERSTWLTTGLLFAAISLRLLG